MKFFTLKSSRLRTAGTWSPRNLLFEMQREFITSGLEDYLEDVEVPNDGSPIVLTLLYPPGMRVDKLRDALIGHNWGSDFEPDQDRVSFKSSGLGTTWITVRVELVLTRNGNKRIFKLEDSRGK